MIMILCIFMPRQLFFSNYVKFYGEKKKKMIYLEASNGQQCICWWFTTYVDGNGSHFLINVELGELGERALCFELIPVKSYMDKSRKKLKILQKSPLWSKLVQLTFKHSDKSCMQTPYYTHEQKYIYYT